MASPGRRGSLGGRTVAFHPEAGHAEDSSSNRSNFSIGAAIKRSGSLDAFAAADPEWNRAAVETTTRGESHTRVAPRVSERSSPGQRTLTRSHTGFFFKGHKSATSTMRRYGCSRNFRTTFDFSRASPHSLISRAFARFSVAQLRPKG